MSEILRSYDPSNGELVGEVQITPIDEIKKIVDSAKIEQKKWHEIGIAERCYILQQISDELMERSLELAQLLSREMGKNLNQSIGEVRSCAYDIPYKLDEVQKALKPTINRNGTVETTIEYNPIGVVGVITPWNYPLSMGHWFIIPALAAGNTVIYKPSEETPMIAQAYVEILNNHLPEGALQIIHGDHNQGEALVKADINMVCFTGSQEVGKEIVRNSADGLKRMIMELGGNDPLVVLEDADLNQAASFAVANSLANSGQMCIATERVLVDRNISNEFEKKVVNYVSAYKVGPWTDQDTHIGPIINNEQRSKILAQVDEAIELGAKVLYGDLNHPERYVNPLVLTDVTSDMSIYTEETFGPIICISKYSTVDEAIFEANNTTFGLGASVFGKKDAEVVANNIEAGMIGINQGLGGVGDTPWVGAKQSGLGYHGSPDGHRQFTQVRVVSKRGR